MTIANSSIAEIHRNAYNAAFHELGLSWHWDSGYYRHDGCAEEERARLHSYLAEHQAHLLSAYDADFLVEAIQAAKARCLEKLSAPGRDPAAFIDWREIQQRQAGA
jgi:hypothetical protein